MEERIDRFFGDNDSAEEDDDDDGSLFVPVEEDYEEEEVYGWVADDEEGEDQVRKNWFYVAFLHQTIMCYEIKFHRFYLLIVIEGVLRIYWLL